VKTLIAHCNVDKIKKRGFGCYRNCFDKQVKIIKRSDDAWGHEWYCSGLGLGRSNPRLLLDHVDVGKTSLLGIRLFMEVGRCNQ